MLVCPDGWDSYPDHDRVPKGPVSLVRCGQCPYCRNRRRWAWFGRLTLEHIAHGQVGRFLTLTYAEDPGELDYRDFQLFMKRWRYHYGRCAFFAIGEYGERYGRGHWHCLLFGQAQQYYGEHEFGGAHFPGNKAWDKGYSYDGGVTPKSIGYVAGYILKRQPPGRRPISRGSGPGLETLRALGVEAALRHGALPAWPGYFSISKKQFPLIDGGLAAFQAAYLDAGGKPPLTLSPDDRSTVAFEQLREGSRDQAESHAVRTANLKGRSGLGQVPRGSL